MDSKAIEHLRQPKSQRQLDEDGVEVGISRQAVDEAVRDYDALAARLASVERERNEIMAMAERREGKLQARLDEAEALLREVYDGRQSLMSVGLVYRIGHTLNHRPADSATHRETPVT